MPTSRNLVRYVSPTGNDSNPGTLEEPWRTLAYALGRIYSPVRCSSCAAASTTRTSTTSTLHAGTEAKPITVARLPGENPVLVGSVSLNRPTTG